jgi:hypothetical protein
MTDEKLGFFREMIGSLSGVAISSIPCAALVGL